MKNFCHTPFYLVWKKAGSRPLANTTNKKGLALLSGIAELAVLTPVILPTLLVAFRPAHLVALVTLAQAVVATPAVGEVAVGEVFVKARINKLQKNVV